MAENLIEAGGSGIGEGLTSNVKVAIPSTFAPGKGGFTASISELNGVVRSRPVVASNFSRGRLEDGVNVKPKVAASVLIATLNESNVPLIVLLHATP